jgi:ASC-1-like (ASCH) protein
MQIEQDLLAIDELLQKGLVDTAYKKYIEIVKTIESKEYEATDRSVKAGVYASFAYFLFGVSEYEEFFNMLIKAQNLGYSKDEIEKVLWEAFIEPNLNEFKTTYEANMKFLLSNEYINTTVNFQELSYWLLPTGAVNEYFMYDREQKLIKEKISLYKYNIQQLQPPSDAFADYLLLEDWNWNNILAYTNAIKKINKKSYIVINDIGKFLSCLQGALLNKDMISNVVIFNHLTSMSEYLKYNHTFLPRNIINLADKQENAQNSLDVIHRGRINKENRKGDNILLSICIPSFNRGKRAYDTVLQLLKSYYDEEIEIILSNNGTQNDTKVYYEKIRDLDDARLSYFAFEENQGMSINFCKICELAQGSFILLLSDEDLVDFNVLDKVMNILNKSKETLAFMRTSTSSQGKPPVKIAQPGRDAILTFMLTSNYMSGNILNNKLLKKHKGIEYISGNLDNGVCFMYPHMFWELLLSQYGNVQGTDLYLIKEGKAEKTNFDISEIKGSDIQIPYYATIEGRLEQHEGFSNIFKDLEICQEDVELYRQMYIKLCAKTFHLVRLSILVYYQKTERNSLELLERTYNFCIREELYKTDKSNRNNYRTDIKVIQKIYEALKKEL